MVPNNYNNEENKKDINFSRAPEKDPYSNILDNSIAMASTTNENEQEQQAQIMQQQMQQPQQMQQTRQSQQENATNNSLSNENEIHLP